ncbi:MAG: nuclear transport factor 2 family protein [Nitrospirota bacterium]|nr:nuclear transport factor 2 family protein [Nitrospirota bacterium]
MTSLHGTPVPGEFGREAANRLKDAAAPGLDGALAALESFYHAFNRRDDTLLAAVWADAPLVQLNNPLGGILRGIGPITELYARVFHGPARVWVAFSDVVAFEGGDMIAFAGRETGEFVLGETVIPLHIRTSRVFARVEGETTRCWRQVHHHGSIDDAGLLGRYQRAVRGADTIS